ncbi:hypothetical protein [Jiulongibacter sp. NS-SX5]|uniref:hypothetical protein n=1 Tax=Jiulongibacter sp. NS-SX5 TaxID=3463854 RepID=UPI004059FC25
MNDYQQNSNLPAIKKLVIVSDENFGQEDAYVRRIYFASKMCSITYTQDVSGNGILYIGSIAASLPRLNPDFQNFVLQNAEKQWVCLAEDFNGFTHIIGTAGTGCRMSYSGSSGPNNGYEIQFIGSNPEPFQIKKAQVMDCLREHAVVDHRKAAEVDFYMTALTYVENEFTLYDAEGDIIDLTGSSFYLVIFFGSREIERYSSEDRVEGDDGENQFLIPADLVISEDKTKISLSRNITTSRGNYTYELWQIDAAGKRQNVMKGLWVLE